MVNKQDTEGQEGGEEESIRIIDIEYPDGEAQIDADLLCPFRDLPF